MNDSVRLLVDSNVWIDSYLGDHLHFDESYRFLKTARARGSQLLYGASKLEGMFYVLASEFERGMRDGDGQMPHNASSIAREFAWGCIENIRKLGTAVGLDEGDLWLACKYRTIGPDFEDDVMLAAAERAHADYIVTWDKELLSTATVRTGTPVQMLALMEL